MDAVVAGKEMSSGVAGMRTEMVWRWHWERCVCKSDSRFENLYSPYLV